MRHCPPNQKPGKRPSSEQAVPGKRSISAPSPYSLLGPYHPLLLPALVTLSVNIIPIMSIATGRIQAIIALVSMGATFFPIVSIARGAIQTSMLMSRNPRHRWH